MFLTNTLGKKKEKFVPINSDKVGIYSCGPTVYRDIHIGNLRTYLSADILKRVLTYNGYKVYHVKNITDVGHMRTDPATSGPRGAGEEAAIDPIIDEALKQGKTPQEVASEYTKKFLDDEKVLNIIPANVFPKATEHISEMIELTKQLLEKGFAYETRGTIYFDVKRFADYGKLSGNTLDKMDKLLGAVRVATETDKKDSIDFALWKKAQNDRSLKWDSPWGEGFPGWHIECSAMSLKYLTDAFKDGEFNHEQSRRIDIHTGGEDNIFPHHEDEIAQSEAATGEKVVNYWLHAGFLLVDGKKMARREGNVYTVSDLVKKSFNPLAFRYLTLTTHYRSRLNFTWDSLKAAETALNNLYRELTGYVTNGEVTSVNSDFEKKFVDAVNNDLDTPAALTLVWDLVRSNMPVGEKAATLYKFDEVLGLDLEKVAEEAAEVPEEVKKLIEQREEAWKKGDFSESDKLRNEIKGKGYEVVDTPEGQKLKKVVS
ncbi:MAG: cysteine--tRNA ligase [Candidatus Woykebacteria bacterium RBG_13_40_15]|uniref:Cysteine--tRNA ligase n=1 Tax=Candidatus Woykebacteria bacterium RBG_13_40_15 TaxID=1802593 RepID=A0A1G1W6P4_9BACT|nr:MAG: cysteine--tRNA ligase [Candidatus Woykebacteria bacterium RBG_13_40_15]